MRFEITGTEGQFGRDVVRVYESPGEEAAREQAAGDGIVVLGIDLLLDMPGFAAAPPPDNLPPPSMRPWRVEGTERLEGRPVVRQYMAQDADDATEFARRDGVVVIRVTRADQPTPPVDSPQAAVTATGDPSRARDEASSDWSSRGGRTHLPTHVDPPPAAPRADAPHRPASHAAVTAADAHSEPLDPATLAALAARPAVAEPPSVSEFRPTPSSAKATTAAPAVVEAEHPRLQAAATATFWFACAAYAVGGLGVAAGGIAGVIALSQQASPAAATSRLVALIGIAIGGPTLFAAVVSHAISGACLALREIVLRRRRKRDY